MEIVKSEGELEEFCVNSPKEQVESEDLSESSDDEVVVELENLKADTIYHEFVDCLKTKTTIEDDKSDVDYNVQSDLVKEGKDDLDDLSSSDSDFEDAVDETRDLEVKIPESALTAAASRHPPFWRLNHQFGQANDEDYKSDDDPDYDPPLKVADLKHREPEKISEEDEDESSSSSSDDESVDTADADADENVENLAEMVEDLAIPNKFLARGELEEAPAPACLVRSIMEFDADGYKSEEDHDFVAQPEELEDVGSSSDSESSSSEDAPEAENMEE